MEQIDRAAIFLNLCLRNQVRREASLPLLDLKTEYSLAIAVAEAAQRRAIRQQYEPQVRAEILAEMRERYGPDWGNCWSGRLALGALMDKVFRERYGL
ncbi:hypothetical protein JKG68_23105 [Microvirga aerilata]|uniref:Uncharacterized protein n=1 Tax=Microvirga aerilata TaxID=670292 RepID=A0A936ZBE4_9HYPH|nr:hypothetical protein [Microvirga aerilata]MBL0406837.1 hypothetical protein [Microvirga aerilata]